MKKIKLILVSLFAVAMTLSCDDDGGDSKINVEQGAVPNIVKSETNEAILNLLEIQEGNSITIGFSIDIFEGKVSSLDIVGIYVKLDGTAEKVILAENVTTFPTSMTLTKEQLMEKYALLNSDADFELGDQLKISADLTLANGTLINLLEDDGSQNYGQDIANSLLFSVTQVYPVACPSDLGGTFNFVTTNVGEPGGGTVAGPLTGTVTFEDEGGGTYAISDASFGGWLGLYGPGSNDKATGVKLVDVCSSISLTGKDQFDEIFTLTNMVANGSELSFHWENDYGEFGDTVLTRTDGTDWPNLVTE